ncbi:MAG: hypothetical protein LBF63_05410 [Treponema sp.]|jgi:uncharacterized protein YutE (UPF0331/DUF86 family)|nr:hypothetical protein [Treponema sp.]
MNKNHLEILKEKISLLSQSADWVKRSYEQCIKIGAKHDYSKDEFDKFENLTSRYARTTDMLINQTLRSLDTVELVDSGTIIDIMNRAEKRGIVESSQTLHELKDLRNEIAHEYQIAQIEQFFESVLTATPILLKIIDNLQLYSEKYTNAGQNT